MDSMHLEATLFSKFMCTEHLIMAQKRYKVQMAKYKTFLLKFSQYDL